MLVIRMQRTGRKGHAQFRVVVQDSRRTPTSGKIVARLGNFNPHTKEATLDKEKASFYLEHGAQPSERVVRLLKAEGVKLPKWVIAEPARKGAIKNTEKLRRNKPKEAPKAEEPVAESAPADEVKSEEVVEETPKEETVAEEANSEESAPEDKTEAADKVEAAPETEVVAEAPTEPEEDDSKEVEKEDDKETKA